MDDPQAAPQSWSTPASFYDVLGVDSAAPDSQIRSAYLRLARSLHPDMPSGSEERFKAIAEAHEVLSHPDKRRQYDAHRQWLRRHEQERRRREADAAAAAQRRARQQDEHRRQAEQDALRRAHGGTPPWRVTFTWTPADLAGLMSMRGADAVVTLTGQLGFQHHGFSIASPVDGGRIDVDPGLPPGDYLIEGRGYFAPFGGPRGDLILQYRWPPPVRGADVFWQVHRPRRDKWRDGSFPSPLYAGPLDIPAGSGDETLRYRGHGLPGEFGGPSGDLLVDVTFDGRPRSHAAHTVLAAAGTAARVLLWAAVALAALWAVLLVLGLL